MTTTVWHPINSLRRIAGVSVVSMAIGWALVPGDVRAEGEPAEKFLEQLRAIGYYELAIEYLDRLDQTPGVDQEMLAAIPLEKAQTYIDQAIASRRLKARDEAFGKAIELLENFVSSQTSHPRAAEANAQLGKLQMVRGAQAMSGEVDEASRRKARDLYIAAAETFDSSIVDLRQKLEQMQGARIDPARDPEKAQLRDQYRFEYLVAQLNAGEARLSAAETYDDPAKEGKSLLEAAVQQFTDLSEKYDNRPQGAMALFSRGKIEQLLGKKDEAISSYLRMLDQPDADSLREAKMGAAAGLVQIELNETPPDYEEALMHSEELVSSLRPNERSSQAAQKLRLAVAKALVAKSQDEENVKAAQRTRATNDARKLLLEARKVGGDHLEETKSLLAELGVDADSEEQVDLSTLAERPESFSGALESARQVMRSIQELEQQMEVLENQQADAEQIQPLQASLMETRENGIEILRYGLAMVDRETTASEVNEARQYLSFLLYNDERLRESSVVGQFLAKAAPGTDVGLKGGLLALSSMQKLIAEGSGESDYFLPAIEQLGDYLRETWPEEPQAAAASGILIRLALSRDQFDRAARLIDEMPEGAEKGRFRRLQGQLKYQQALQLESDVDAAGAEELLASAVTDLTSGLEAIPGGLVDPADLRAALFLAKAQLKSGEPAAAVATLENPKYGPVGLVEKIDPPSEAFLPELYRVHLQALVGQMTTSDADSGELMKRASGAMENLRQTAKDSEGQKRLVGIYLALAGNIREQLDQATPARKAKLISAFREFLNRISESTEDTATLQWVGQTLMEMGESSMRPGETVASGQAKELLTSAAETFERLKQREDAPSTIAFLNGKTLRLLGRYKEALDELEAVLKESPMMLDAQREAALAYENWATVLDEKYKPAAYKAAMMGGRPGADQKNVIWGWGRISQLTQRDERFRDKFFEARYHVAFCRFRQGQVTDSDAVLEQAVRDITSVAALYPELGGPEQRARFDRLLREIQTELGQTPEGLPPLQ